MTHIDILLMVEKGIRERICHSIYQYAKANNKYMKDYDKHKELPYLRDWMKIIYMVGHCHKSFQQIILSVNQRYFSI